MLSLKDPALLRRPGRRRSQCQPPYLHSWLLSFSISMCILYHHIQVCVSQGVSGSISEAADDEIISFSRPPSLSTDTVFSPIVTATCRAGIMTVKTETLHNFEGVVHSRDYRKPQCSGYGDKTKVTFLKINMLAQKDDPDFCGIFSQASSDERSIAIAVRTHRTLELVDDKFYLITCGKAGFQNSRNQTSLVNLQLMRNDKKVDQVVYGREYILRADMTQPDGQFGMRVKRCFSFSDSNHTVQLIDDNGCPQKSIISEFTYNMSEGVANAKLFSMFRFPGSNRVHFQCDILVCRDQCETISCDRSNHQDQDNNINTTRARSLETPRDDALLHSADEGALMASYSVFVVEPGEPLDIESAPTDCQSASPPWLLYLCVAFGILFLVMLIINVILCSAMTCSCVTNDHSTKEASVVEEFDPYTRSWHGSQYSLNGHIKPIPPPLISVDTSQSISSGSEAGLPAVYGLPVHSRPSSRYSNRSQKRSVKHVYCNGRIIVK